MATKIALSVFCLALLVCTQANPAIIKESPKLGDHDINQCADPTKATVVLMDQTVEMAASFLTVHKKTVNFPESGVNTHAISCLIVENELGDDGGYASLEPNTGVGYYTSKIYLESQRGKAMKFHVQIFAES